MNSVYKQIHGLLLVGLAASVLSVHAIDRNKVKQQKTVLSAVWYKKRSTQIAAALVTSALVVYAIAVHMDKVASPIALFTALLCTQQMNSDVIPAAGNDNANNNVSNAPVFNHKETGGLKLVEKPEHNDHVAGDAEQKNALPVVQEPLPAKLVEPIEPIEPANTLKTDVPVPGRVEVALDNNTIKQSVEVANKHSISPYDNVIAFLNKQKIYDDLDDRLQ